jgi:hypothetical protein
MQKSNINKEIALEQTPNLTGFIPKLNKGNTYIKLSIFRQKFNPR